jgi:hypothetical protein
VRDYGEPRKAESMSLRVKTMSSHHLAAVRDESRAGVDVGSATDFQLFERCPPRDSWLRCADAKDFTVLVV